MQNFKENNMRYLPIDQLEQELQNINNKNYCNLELSYSIHNMRNALNGISASCEYLQILIDDIMCAIDSKNDVKKILLEQYEISNIALKSCYDLSQMINNLKTSHTEKIDYNSASCNINEAINASIKKVQTVAKKQKKALEVNVKSSNDISLIAINYDLFIQILDNLFFNCIDAIPNCLVGEINISIEDADNNYCICRISDNGPGVTKDNLNKIFEMNHTTKDKDKENCLGGSGIGLHFCQYILNTCGGSIEYDCDYTLGACFVLKIPTQKNRS